MGNREEFLKVFPIHTCKSFVRECCDLINSEWPRSTAARLQMLFMSSENFPASLILVLNETKVVGHVKLSEVRLGGPEIMLESMIIHKDHRRKGWGKYLMDAAEKYVVRKGKSKIYLSTKGQEGFYEKLGYEVCAPIMFFGFCDLTPKSNDKVEKETNNIKRAVVEENQNCKSPTISAPSNHLPPPPPPPPPTKNNKTRPEIYKTSKTFMCKNTILDDKENQPVIGNFD